MITKKKKNILTLSRSGLGSDLLEETQSHGPLLNSLTELFDNFGFQQITPQAISQARPFREVPALARAYNGRIVSVPGSEGMILSPTHVFNLPNLYQQGTVKWFYVSPVVQNAKLDVEHELGVFILGEEGSLAYIQLINVINSMLHHLGIGELVAEISSLGCDSCQKSYQEVLQHHIYKLGNLCPDCQNKLKNEMFEIFDCRNNSCQTILGSVPQIVDFLDEPCRNILAETLESLDELEISYVLNPTLYNSLLKEKILFRLSAGEEVLGEGGNFTLFSKYSKTPGLPMLGFISSLEKLKKYFSESPKPLFPVEVFVVSLGMKAHRRSLLLFRQMQRAGIRTREAILGSLGIKTQLKEAQDSHAEISLIIGQKEAQDETVILRDMRSGMQEIFTLDRIIEEVKKRLGK